MQSFISKKIITGGLVFALLMIVGVSAVSYQSMSGLIETSKSVEHIYQVKTNIEVLLCTLRDVETGRWVYRLTGDEAQLKPDNPAIKTIVPEIQALRMLTVDNLNQQDRLDILESLIAKRLDLALPSALQQSKKADSVRQVLLPSQGKMFMEQIRKLSQQMEKEEQTLFEQRLAVAARIVQNSQRISILTTSLSLALLLLIYYFLYRQKTRLEEVRDGRVLDTTSWANIRLSDSTLLGCGQDMNELARINESLQIEISDRKLAEEALRVSEERFRIALKNSPTVVFNQDTEFRYTWIYNPALELAVDEVVGKLESEIFSPEDAQRMLEIKHRVLATGVGTREETFVTFNGEVRYWDLTLEPLHNLDGEIIGITCASTDITDLRVREVQLRAIFESAHEAIVIVDDEARHVETNPAASGIFGLSLLELLNRQITDFIEPGLDFDRAWRTFQEQGESTGEMRLLRPDGSIREVEFTSQANFLPGLHLLVLRDVTVRKQAENALRESQRFIQQIADTTPNLIYIYDLSQNCNVYANRQCREFFGYTQPEIQVMGSPLLPELLHPEDKGRVIKVLKQLATAQDGEVIEDEYRLKDSKGEWRWFHSWEVVFTRNSQGKPEQILGTAIDITEQKRTEEIRACLEAEKELRKLQLSFFSMASHEFRTPLSVILVTAQLLQSYAGEWSEEKMRRNLQRIAAAAKTMTQLLDDILTINRAESGKLELNLQLIVLEKFCLQRIEEMQLNAISKPKINFLNQSKFIKAYTDEKLLRSILNNLLSNAIKYSPQGGEIYLILKCKKEEVSFTIQDSGLGIPLEDQKHVFEPFHRGGNIENIPGTGLGLTVIKKYLELQGGKIVLKSEVGVGTTVAVTLPCKTC